MKRLKYELVRKLINLMVDDLICNTKVNIDKYNIKNAKDILECENPIVVLSEKMRLEEKYLREFLKNKMYDHPKVKTMNFKAKKIISDLFDLFLDEPYLLPNNWKEFNDNSEKYINIADKTAVTIKPL